MSLNLRPPSEVMQLDRMGSSFQTRLSFMRTLIRRMAHENWRFEKQRFDVDELGYGVSVFIAHTPERSYSLVVFTNALAPNERTDRVIAKAWDATFNLFDGVPSEDDIQRLALNTPKQEAGRFLPSELSLARANKSLRLFEHIVSRLADGKQPDIDLVASVGYLMRTTAVYGSGKFGCADRAKTEGRPELRGAFQIEMLVVYLFRWFTIELVEHVADARAKSNGGIQAAKLNSDIKNYFGIGNATGLGMAPFLIKHPLLIHSWVAARETALARVRELNKPSAGSLTAFLQVLKSARQHIDEWSVGDPEQTERIGKLRADLQDLASYPYEKTMENPYPWEALYQHAKNNYSLEGQEFTAALLLEPHGELIDDLTDEMFASEVPTLNPAMKIENFRNILFANYKWALEIDFTSAEAQEIFWYYSEDKLEPRLGDRATEPGSELEMPVTIARDVSELSTVLEKTPGETTVGEFLISNQQFRHTIRRVQTIAESPYGEINNNLIGPAVRPLDMLRFKLAFFGASKFDPKSDLWTRISMYQGAPLPDGLGEKFVDNWAYSIKPKALS